MLIYVISALIVKERKKTTTIHSNILLDSFLLFCPLVDIILEYNQIQLYLCVRKQMRILHMQSSTVRSVAPFPSQLELTPIAFSTVYHTLLFFAILRIRVS